MSVIVVRETPEVLIVQSPNVTIGDLQAAIDAANAYTDQAKSDAQDYADTLADNYDPAGAAAALSLIFGA